MKKSGTRTPHIELEEIGPAADLVIRRTRLASSDLFKTACRTPAAAKVVFNRPLLQRCLFLIINFVNSLRRWRTCQRTSLARRWVVFTCHDRITTSCKWREDELYVQKRKSNPTRNHPLEKFDFPIQLETGTGKMWNGICICYSIGKSTVRIVYW